MRRYETIVIVDPDLPDEQLTAVIDKTKDLIPNQGGYLLTLEDWGTLKLAYEIKKRVRGHYYRFDFCGNGGCVDEMERLYRIDDRVLKYLTVLLDENADLEVLKEEKAKAEKEKAEKAAQAEKERAERAERAAREQAAIEQAAAEAKTETEPAPEPEPVSEKTEPEAPQQDETETVEKVEE